MATARSPKPSPRKPRRQIPLPEDIEMFVFHNVSWETYLQLDRLLEDTGRRLKFCEGKLELMTLSFNHENAKSIIRSLLETYCLDGGIYFVGVGSTTQRAKQKYGAEPDESYSFIRGQIKPQLAIEVVVSSRMGVNRFKLYAGLGVSELWVWQRGKLLAKALQRGRYVDIRQSRHLPGLDLKLVEELSGYPSAFDAVVEFRRRRKK
ncbi:MAG: Uma2 family endonuclease [Verrucomicrobiales bacterium]